jgi:hypothetical protein
MVELGSVTSEENETTVLKKPKQMYGIIGSSLQRMNIFRTFWENIFSWTNFLVYRW